MKKRILSILLLCCMVLTLLPVTVSAATITALCFRLRNRENRRKDGANKHARHEQEEKSQ